MAPVKLDILFALQLSLIITAIFSAFREGQIFGWIKSWAATKADRAFGKTASMYLQKPVWGCLTCMGPGWAALLTWSLDPWLMLTVCGINAIIDKWVCYGDD